MASIDDEIEKLPEREKMRFDNILLDRLYDRKWCKGHGIKYSSPNVEKAKELLYNEMFHPHRN